MGPNGAGKTTLLNIAVGLLAPTRGHIDVLGAPPARGPAELARVGFMAQETPTYSALSVADHLRMGAHLNPGWTANSPRVASRNSDSTRRSGPASCRRGSAPSWH